LLTLALTLIGAQHCLTNAAPNMAPPPRDAPPLEVVAANYARKAALASFEPAEPNPAHVTLIITYAGQTPSAGLIKTLTDLQIARRISALDSNSMPGRIFVLGDQAAVFALRDLPGVNSITRGFFAQSPSVVK
jgi:hypothetical protein